MYDLDTDGQAMTRVTAIGINTIVQSVANIAERRIVPVSDRWLVLRPSSRANRPTCIWSQINASVVRLYLNTLS
ncbi:putative Nuclear pore complex protein Nup155 [Daphnia magna]|uniref:Putative Nuclear pore complex protein Nup155 n=1 Tax=Daphnia magna TaxID=35525 RepID=A0A162D076_9CRUS|nr:putative Nuclear pore complex protein Nup155 [Daphnia magna]